MNNTEFLEALNECSFSGNKEKVLEILNSLFDSGEYKVHLNLVFDAISMTEMYGFLSYLNRDERESFLSWDTVRSGSYVGKIMPFYNSGQLSLLLEIEKYHKIFLSAPTSFGKTSLLLEYIVYKFQNLGNVLIIVPTNSLLEELYMKLIDMNKRFMMGYQISTQPYYSEGVRNFLIVTPERFLLLYESCDISVFDIVVMDETYKIVDSKNERISDFIDSRALRFRKVADLIGKTSKRLILLSPFTYYLTDSMNRFLSMHCIKKIDRKIEYVNKQIFCIDDSDSFKSHFKISVKGYTKSASISTKVNLLLRILQDEKNIVYVSQYSKAYEIINALDWTRQLNVTDRYLKFISHLEKTYTVDDMYEWKIISALKKGVGIYISPLPRYIKREIIRLYEENVLGTLVVTTSFTEGVNTNASNLIFTSLINGPTSNRLSDIDVLNVSGRAGRFAQKSIGKIYCISEEVFERVNELQNNAQVKLENYNYCVQGHKRIDFEIDMIQDEYLSDSEKEEKQVIKAQIDSLGLSSDDLRLSLNVSTNWKLILYKYFQQNPDIVQESYNRSLDLLKPQPHSRINSLTYIFEILKDVFSKAGIDGFACQPYDIRAFDQKGTFIWGRFYRVYCSGKISNIISENLKYITGRFKDFIIEHNLENLKTKKAVQSYFDEERLGWILRYYNSDLSPSIDAFYSETFKFISNIVQYKIPFYISFFVSILKLYLQKNTDSEIYDFSCLDSKKITMLFEDGSVYDDYSKLIDYGISNDIVMKLHDGEITIEMLQTGEYNHNLFDDYEHLLLSDFLNCL